MVPMSRHHFKTGIIALISQRLMRGCANFLVQGHSIFREEGNEECIDDSSGMPGGNLGVRIGAEAVIFRLLERHDVIENFHV